MNTDHIIHNSNTQRMECQHCGFRNSEVQMGGVIPDKGVHFELRVEKGDMKACGGWRRSSTSCALTPLQVALAPSCQGRHVHLPGAPPSVYSGRRHSAHAALVSDSRARPGNTDAHAARLHDHRASAAAPLAQR